MKVADLFATLGLRFDKTAFASANNALGGIKRALTSVAGIAGGITVGLSFKDAFSFKDQINQLDIASKGAIGNLDDFASKALDVSDDTGVLKESILEGARSFVALTGDGETALSKMDLFGKVTAATGAEMKDVTGVAARLTQNMGILPDSFEKAFSVLIASGKAGAIELKEMASLFGGLTPAAEKFAGGRGVEGLAKLSAALQLTMQGAGSASQAATMLEALMGAISGNSAKRLAKEGIKVFNKDGSLREFDTIIGEIKAKNFRRDKLIEIFGRKEAVGAFEQLVKVEGAWKGLTDQTLEANDVEEDFAKRMQQDTVKLSKAWNKFKNALTRVFMVVVSWMAKMLEHAHLAGVALGSLAGAFVLLQLKAIAAAVMSAAAWIAALIPFLLLAALVAAVIFVVQDLWVAFHGGESVFKDLYLAARKWLGDKMNGVMEDLAEGLVNFSEVYFGENSAVAKGLRSRLNLSKQARAGRARNAAFQAEFEARGEAGRLDVTEIQQLQEAVAGFDQLELLTSQQRARFDKAQELLAAQPAAMIQAANEDRSVNIENSINLTIAATSGSPEELQRATEAAVKRAMDASLREAAAVTGR